MYQNINEHYKIKMDLYFVGHNEKFYMLLLQKVYPQLPFLEAVNVYIEILIQKA